METRNCPKCGKLFVFMSSKICKNCEIEEEENFQKLKQYIQENPNGIIQQISDATDVSTKRILQYVREGRLTISKGLQSEIKCNHCGVHISRGKYCDKCVIKLNNSVNELFENKESKTANAKMHISRSNK